MENGWEPCCGVRAVCCYGGKRAGGVPVALLNDHGRVLERQLTDTHGVAWLTVDHAGEYIVRATSQRPYVPRSIYIHAYLEPCGCLPLMFRFRKPPIHRGCGTIRITLRDVFYKNLPLAGGEYELWQP